YFQDKWTLIDSIVEVLLEETNEKIIEIFQQTNSVKLQLQRILEIKFELMEKYKLLTLNLNEVNVLDPKFKRISDRVFTMECDRVRQVLERGIKSGELETNDVAVTSNLYVTTVRGLGVFGICSNPS